MTTNPPTAAKFLQILKDEGVKVEEVGNWATHNRAGHGPWGPVYGVIIHHTVTSGSAATVAICRDGYASLPGPLCHGVITKDGTVHLVGYGRANHAGGGDPRVLAAVQAEAYAVAPPKPTKGNADGVDGNRSFYGFECENLGDGHDPWPAAQLLAIEKVGAAICRYHKWKAQSVIGHLEWSKDKSDPRGFTMASMRARVSKRLAPKPVARYHTVIDGDTLYSIAKEHGTTVAKLRTLNPKVKNDIIVPGDPATGRIRYA
jgi:hypothetical protein